MQLFCNSVFGTKKILKMAFPFRNNWKYFIIIDDIYMLSLKISVQQTICGGGVAGKAILPHKSSLESFTPAWAVITQTLTSHAHQPLFRAQGL